MYLTGETEAQRLQVQDLPIAWNGVLKALALIPSTTKIGKKIEKISTIQSFFSSDIFLRLD